MTSPAPAPWSLTPAAFRVGGRTVRAGLVLGLLLILFLAWTAPDILVFLPVVLLLGLAGGFLVRRPLLNLAVLLIGFVAVADRAAGFQPQEIVYALYLYGYLGCWFILRLFVYRERILFETEDKAIFLFLVLVPLTAPLTVFFGGDVRIMVSETISLSLFALYFPVREACVRYRHGVRVMLLVLGFVAAAVALRNLFNFQQILLQATQAWQVEKGRVPTNDNLLMVGAIFALTLLVFARRPGAFLLLLGNFAAVFAGLILTQSRGFWVAFLLGSFFILVVSEARYRRRLILLGLAGTVAILTVGFVFFGAYMDLLLGGLVERFASLQTAATQDISLVNRFHETAAVWERIVQNPIVGHGMGVSYYFYDLTWDYTRVDTFVHNGYVSLWFKFGIWGLGLVLFVWLRTAWRGVQAYRSRMSSPWTRACGLAAASCLVAMTLSTITSNPFYLKDSMFMFSLVAALAAGAYRRTRYDALRPANGGQPS